MHLDCTVITAGASTIFPRLSFFWSYTDKTDPDDLAFNILPKSQGHDYDLKLYSDGDGTIHLVGDKVAIGRQNTCAQTMLDVAGTVRVGQFEIQNLPSLTANA